MTGDGANRDDGAMEPTAATRPAPPRPSIVRRLAVATGGLARPLAGRRLIPLYAVLEHRGRVSGTVRRTPIVALKSAEGVVIPMPFGPSTQWTQNILAAGGARLRWKGRDWQLSDPKVVGFEDAAAALGAMRPIAKRAESSSTLSVRLADSA